MSAARENVLRLNYPMSLGTYDNYAEAQKAVDYLADKNFPVQDVMLVGTDLKQIERVTGRLTTGRVLLGGALSGVWIGVFVGLVFTLFEGTDGMMVRLTSTMLMGAVFGLVWAWLGYRMTGGQRDFTSVTQVVATRYEVLVEHKHAARGRELLAELDPMRAAQEQLRLNQAQAQAAYDRQQSSGPTPST